MANTGRRTATVQVCAECGQAYRAVRPSFSVEQMLAHGRCGVTLDVNIMITCGCAEDTNPSRAWEQARSDWAANLHTDEVVFLGVAGDPNVYVATR